MTNCIDYKTMQIGTEELDAAVAEKLCEGWSLWGSPMEANGNMYQAIILMGCEDFLEFTNLFDEDL